MANREQEAKSVDSVTDYVEEKEDVDMGKATAGLSSLVSTSGSDTIAAAIRISQEDIKILTDELEITKDVAERMLQSHGGNVKNALVAYISVQS